MYSKYNPFLRSFSHKHFHTIQHSPNLSSLKIYNVLLYLLYFHPNRHFVSTGTKYVSLFLVRDTTLIWNTMFLSDNMYVHTHRSPVRKLQSICHYICTLVFANSIVHHQSLNVLKSFVFPEKWNQCLMNRCINAPTNLHITLHTPFFCHSLSLCL